MFILLLLIHHYMFDIYSTYCHAATSILVEDFISYFFVTDV